MVLALSFYLMPIEDRAKRGINMAKTLKIILIIITFFVGALLMAITKEASNYGNPIGYFIVCPATFIAIGAIWKYKSQK